MYQQNADFLICGLHRAPDRGFTIAICPPEE
jgi:hypothetical protein